jgi:hypothetical protein
MWGGNVGQVRAPVREPRTPWKHSCGNIQNKAQAALLIKRAVRWPIFVIRYVSALRRILFIKLASLFVNAPALLAP